VISDFLFFQAKVRNRSLPDPTYLYYTPQPASKPTNTDETLPHAQEGKTKQAHRQ
jgi:hypothetical protein